MRAATLLPSVSHRLRRWSDEDDAFRRAGFGELRTFRKEPIARMDRIDLRGHRDPQHFFNRKVGFERTQAKLAAAAAADLVGFVGLEAMQGELVLFRIDRDRR